MKTWLILLCLATTGISCFSQDQEDEQTRVPGSYLPSKEPVTVKTSESVISKFFKKIWNMFTDQEDDQTRMPGSCLPSKGAETMETSEPEPATWKLFKKIPNIFMEKKNVQSTKTNMMTSTEKNQVNREESTEKIQVNDKFVDGAEAAVTAPATAEPATTPTAAVPTTCSPQKCPPPRINPWATCTNSTSEDDATLAEALTEFAVKFYKTATQHKSRETNFVFSPISISTALSNLLLGTCGETKDRLEKLLSYPKDFVCVHEVLKAFRKSKALTSANAIFYQPALKLESDFRNLSKAYYQTELLPLTNNSHQAVLDINAWVSRHTGGKIKKLLDDMDPDAQMVLLNAVYFHSKWKTLFKLKNTKEEYFYRPNLPPIKVPMMTSKKYPVASYTDHYLQARVARFQLSHGMSLVIIVPRSLSQNLSEVEDQLSGLVFKSMMAKLETLPFKPTIVSLPKFKVDSSQDLLEIIGEMDYGFFFDANLCGISQDEELAVSGAKHRAMVQINEEGVEAAAATEFSLARSANFFEVQQPFLFSLWKDQTAPLFLGRISDPQAP